MIRRQDQLNIIINIADKACDISYRILKNYHLQYHNQ